MGIPLKVLFVEDSEADAELTAAELARGNFELQTERVQTEEAMRAALADANWDLVICDYRLPCFSAEGALSTLKASNQDLPFIITSGAVTEIGRAHVELQSRGHLVCRLLLEKKKKTTDCNIHHE